MKLPFHPLTALLFLLLPHALAQSWNAPYFDLIRSAGIDLGYRTDEGQWTIAADGGPNIISDLEWRDLSIVELRADAEVGLGRFFLAPELAVGLMFDGENQDSDFARDNRRGEFSRSLSETDGSTYDFSLALGYDLLSVETHGLRIAPILGYGYHAQNHTDTNGRQVIDRPALEAVLDGEDPATAGPPSLGRFVGENASYDASWHGPFIGLHLEAPLSAKWTFLATYTYAWVDYEADLFWNLRNLPFQNFASGTGQTLEAAVEYQVREDLAAKAAVTFRTFETDPGIQTDPSGPIDLNGASWDSLGISLGFRLDF